MSADPTTHEVRVVDGRFAHAVCTCGWRGAGRRNREAVRTEARDHALLYADGRGLVAPAASAPAAESVDVVVAEPVEPVEA
ncbi:MAG: hypothetical protein U0S36_14080 [Candidatus Nanopelagicales bacterium]